MRLIDADELKKEAQWMEMPDNQGIHFDVQAVSVSSIDLAPTVDAEPVRHGEWIQETEANIDGKAFFHCSECSAEQFRSIYATIPRCWWCGAKMDKE